MKFSLIFLSIIAISCSSSMNKSNVVYKILHSGEFSSIENKEFLLIEDNQDYISAIEKLNIDESEYDKLLNVDFKTNNICILLLGQRNTGGYSISVDYIKKKQKTLFIKTKELTPEKHSNVITVITNPYCLVVIPKMKNIIIK
jgi:PrcB C-terminal